MFKKCLLLKFPDEREVFTEEKNYKTLSEFSKTFNVKIITVEADRPTMLEPEEIAKTFCSQSKNEFELCKYNLTYSTTTEDAKARGKILQKAYDVRSYIETKFLNKETVKIKDLYTFFQKHDVAFSTLYRHLSCVKTKLKNQGVKIEKIKAGCYRLA